MQHKHNDGTGNESVSMSKWRKIGGFVHMYAWCSEIDTYVADTCLIYAAAFGQLFKLILIRLIA